MKTKIIALLALLLAVTAPAQFTNINYTTVYSPTTYTNFLRMTIPGVATNVTVTIVTTNSQVGDSLTLTAIKINGGFAYVNAVLATNTAGLASIAYVTSAIYDATNSFTGGGSSSGGLTSSNLAALFGLSYAIFTNGNYYVLSFQAQPDTNHVTLTGGVDCTSSPGSMNQTYTWTNGVYVGNNGDGWTLTPDGYGNWYIGDDYFSTNFPYTWAPIACTNPPTGSYGQIFVPVYTPATNLAGISSGTGGSSGADIDPFILTQSGTGTNIALLGTNSISGTTFYQTPSAVISSNVTISTNLIVTPHYFTNELLVTGMSFPPFGTPNVSGIYTNVGLIWYPLTNTYSVVLTNVTAKTWWIYTAPTDYYFATNGLLSVSKQGSSNNTWFAQTGEPWNNPPVGSVGYLPYYTTNTVWTTNVTYQTNLNYSSSTAQVAINTNSAGTNTLFVCGAVNSTVGFYVNGVRILPGTNSTFITNTVTAYNFTNQVLQSKQIVSYTTNYAFWGASNYLARVAGLVSWQISSGDDGGANPSTAPSSFPMTLYGTYATNYTGWFVLTNGFVTQSNISLYVTLGTNSWGTTLANPGSASIFSVDHWELYGRTNFLDYQFAGSKEPPKWGWQYVTLDFVKGLLGTAFNNNFVSSTDTNNVTHFGYWSQNYNLFDLTSQTKGVRAIGLTPGGYATYTDAYGNTYAYPTNVVMTIAATNLTSGFTLLAQTNLLQTFFVTTNYTSSTSGGITSLTIPVIPGPGQWFFYAVNGFNFGATFNEAVTFNGGTLYPSNTWSLATITNGLANGSIITVNSNGVKLVDVWMSNGVPILKPHW